MQTSIKSNNNLPVILLLGILFFAACSASDANMVSGNDLASKKEMLRQKRSELNELKSVITKLETEIADLDTTVREKARRLVTTTTVGQKDFSRFVDIQAAVQEGESVYASSETGGRVIRLAVKEGQLVRRGSLIATLDMETVEKQIAELEKSKELAVELYDRQKRLWDQNIGSEVQYLQAKNNVERLDKSLETMRFQLTKSKVYAPISGYVHQEMVKSGEMAGPGAPIVSILKTDVVKVVADVPEAYLKAIRRGEQVTVSFPALDMEKTAKVSMIGRTINPANRTFTVEVNLANPQGVLKPNLLAVMKINDFSQKNAVTVPLELVQQDVNGKDYVYIKGSGPDGDMAQKVFVTTGESYNGEIIIAEGLKGGEVLIVDGARGLSENELITIQS